MQGTQVGLVTDPEPCVSAESEAAVQWLLELRIFKMRLHWLSLLPNCMERETSSGPWGFIQRATLPSHSLHSDRLFLASAFPL